MHDVAISTLYFVLSVFGYASFGVDFGGPSSTFIQVLNKNGGEFLLDKNVNSMPKERRTHKPLIVLAW